MKLRIETWTSDKGNSEIHHFIEGTDTYVFGVNESIIGSGVYKCIRTILELTGWKFGTETNGSGAREWILHRTEDGGLSSDRQPLREWSELVRVREVP